MHLSSSNRISAHFLNLSSITSYIERERDILNANAADDDNEKTHREDERKC
jgi:hypothetical protein